MRSTLIVFLITLFTVSFIATDVYAKRFGGGRSFGVSRPSQSYNSNLSRTTNVANKPQSTGNRWFGPIAGLITGGLLASLFMGNGLATGIFTWLIVAIVGLLLVRLIAMRRNIPHNQNINTHRQPTNYQSNNSFFESAAPAQTSVSGGAFMPADIDTEALIREAKKQFIRLQAAYDEKNIDDLRRFTSPEVFAEIQLQLQERGDKPNKTEVLNLYATLLDASTESANESIASIRFTGTIDEDGKVASLDEIWHFRKSAHNQQWVVAGIEQQT